MTALDVSALLALVTFLTGGLDFSGFTVSGAVDVTGFSGNAVVVAVTSGVCIVFRMSSKLS
ncbi:MAG: hypothetical protein ACOYNW_01360 [Undibacterium curvum]|uniref:hypothetical protein n=1 Tax=Undibacterium curvum TaxID=2762294 RepID=UPI003BE3D702